MSKITKDMTISDIFTLYPEKSYELAAVLQKAGLGCVGCLAASSESLECGMLNHGFTPEMITFVIEELNKTLND